MKEDCLVDWCELRRWGRSPYCRGHLTRMQNGQDLDAPWRYRKAERKRCSVKGCPRPHSAKGWCGRHYDRWLRSGQAAEATIKKCDMPGCEREHFARGWCKTHYAAWWQHGDPLGSASQASNGGPELRAAQAAQTALVRADLRMARTLAEHQRWRDVGFYLARASSHGRELTGPERAYANGLRAGARPGQNPSLMVDILRLTAEGHSAKEIAQRLGTTARTVQRYRAAARENGEH